ncbi:MAG: OmpP1/FadL family transporter [Desulfobaccales bacterium]
MMLKKIGGLVLVIIGIFFPILGMATNGDDLIGVGPISRAMGGVGIAAPQDAISAVFSNPAAMCFGAFCPSNQVDFAGTGFMPDVNAKIISGSGPFGAFVPENYKFAVHSSPNLYPIPALGISYAFPELPDWRFGFGAYGVTGLGVDYRGTGLDQGSFFGAGAPLASGAYSNLSIMKFAPTAAYQVNKWLSLGAAFNISYSTLDLRAGSSSGFAPGAQIGAIVKPGDNVSIGLTYTTPQDVNEHSVLPGADNTLHSLALSSPNNLGAGVSWEPLPKKLLLETDFKWLDWADADGYRQFGWRDQYVIGVGGQYKPIPKLALRLGYNYGNNPVHADRNFSGFNSANPGSPPMTSVQGTVIPTYYYETFRTIGFPAIITNMITCGIGYDVTEHFSVNAGYEHGFNNTITATGTNLVGEPTKLSSSLSENGVDLGLSWRF